MKLWEFLQTAYRKVVKWFFRPVLAFWIVEPLDEVENPFVIASPSPGRRHYLLDILFLRLLDVVCFSQYFCRIGWHSVFAGLIRLE